MSRDLVNYILIGIGTAVVLVLYTIFAFLPLHHRLSLQKALLKEEQRKVAEVQDLVSRYDEFMDRLGRLQMEMEQLDTKVPREPRMPELLKSVSLVAAQCQIRDFEFSPQPMVRKETYSIQPIQVNVTCNYHTLGNFISELSSLPRVVNTQEVQIVGRDKTGTTDSISAQLTLVTYVRRNP